ncbi:acyl-CoA thioesterase [Gudongella oleilytica]|uniref:acyl-CoA thioesterase n=2 Tax=Gudongella oleilytica TaxID=1582259 RepID=UPI002A36985B|nr:acyl-CoA thioesterase [Gudongella oleilytica]MDY0257941.1 acyl-CoA thioesterase [Gudongella oleilytica]
MKAKTVAQSRVSIGNMMQPDQANVNGGVHGGEIMKMMDTCAGIVARRHSRMSTVTARVDELEFLLPIRVGNLVTCHGQLTYVGKQSMDILVTVMVEDLKKSEPSRMALTAYFTMVALDENGLPTEVPRLIIETDEEQRLYDEGESRYKAHKEKRKNWAKD